MYPELLYYSIENPVTLGTYYTDDVRATKLEVNDGDPDLFATMLRIVIPVDAGDFIKVHAFGRWTNDIAKVTGIGWHLWLYDVDDGLGASGTSWRRISPLCGENILPNGSMHHMPGQIFCVYQIPEDWPVNPDTGKSHRATVVFRASAMRSTGLTPVEYITVDKPYGALLIDRVREGVPSA